MVKCYTKKGGDEKQAKLLYIEIRVKEMETQAAEAKKRAEEECDRTESGVSVEVDKVMRPGALASGTVTFSDGVATQWQLDQFGRLAVTPKDDHKPSEEDLMAFQQQLQVELRKAGF